MIEAAICLLRLDHFAGNGNRHLRPVYPAMRLAGIGFALVQQHSSRFQAPKKRPFVAIVGDDTDRSLGVAGFHRRSMRCLAAITPGIVVMSRELVPSVYAAAAAAAAWARTSTLIIETRAEHKDEWIDLVKEAAPTANLLICTYAAGTA